MLYDELPIAQKAAMMRVCIKNGITNPDDIRTAYNNYVEGRNIFDGLSESYHRASAFGQFLANGGHIYDGTSEPTGQMRKKVVYTSPYYPGRKFATQREVRQANWDYKHPEEKKRRDAALRQQRMAAMEEAMRKRQSDYLTTSNDNTWVESRDPRVAAARPKNPHLAERALQGAKAHAAWAKEHPVMNAWGMALGAAPFAVAAAPAIAAGGEGLIALGDAAAATTAGQALTSVLTPVATAAATEYAGAPAWMWAEQGLNSLIAAHGLNTAIEEGGVSPTTALELLPLGQAAAQGTRMIVNTGRNALNALRGPIVESADVAQTMEQLEAAYAQAVASGNKPEALRILEQAYIRSGIPQTEITMTPEGNALGWFHGSEWGNHTIFDSSAMNATIGGVSAAGKVKGNFLTTDFPSAARYAGTGRWQSMADPKTTVPTTFWEKMQNLFGKYKPRTLYPAERVGELGPKPSRLFDTEGKAPINHLDKTDNVIYPMYVNPGEKPMILDFEGKPWSQSPVEFPNNFYLKRWIRDDAAKTYRNEIVPFKSKEEAMAAWEADPINVYRGKTDLEGQYFDEGIRYIEGYNSTPRYETVKLVEERVPNTTNGAVQTAAREGNTSVLMRNVIDSNGGPEGVHYAIDDFVTLKPEQMKIADITYDDEGILIPLSKRFQWTNKDSRYGLGGYFRRGLRP